MPQEFFAWISAHVFTERAIFERFAIFWGVSWFTIVKGWHAAEFAILFALTLAALRAIRGRKSHRDIMLAAVFCVMFAASDEYHQTFVPGRGGTITDVAIDSLGVFLGTALAARWGPGKS